MKLLISKKAFTLTEVLFACVLMAVAFLPILGVLGSSIKATEKDGSTQKAVTLCQEKLNMALQLPFSAIDTGTHTNRTFTSINQTNPIELVIGAETIDGIVYTSTMVVSMETVIFNVPTCDFQEKADKPDTPQDWGFQTIAYRVENMLKRYTVTITWADKGTANEKTYTLSSLKADIRKG